MVGVGSADTDLSHYRTTFCSMIGKDTNSWGLSYSGTIQHAGKTKEYSSKFDRDTVIGVHLDGWTGQLSFFMDNKALGVAADDLRGRELYPMACSTAARTKMKVIRSSSTCFSLQYLCCVAIGKELPDARAVQRLPIPPGVKNQLCTHLEWVFKINARSCRTAPAACLHGKKQRLDDRFRGVHQSCRSSEFQ